MRRIINNIIPTLLLHDHLPPDFWVEALHMTVHLLNLTPSTSIQTRHPNSHTPNSFGNPHLILTFESSGAYVILSFLLRTNSHLVLPPVSSLATRIITVAIVVLISPLEKSLFPVMSPLMKNLFLFAP